ncbi:GNAT family N-acetyltransferase [Metabacillus sp. HB246100]
MTGSIRSMTESDIAQIQHVAKTSWQTTYKGIIPLDIQENFIQMAYSDENLKKRMETTIFLVAEVEGKVIGFSNVFPLKNRKKAELGAIYLFEEFQGKGIGTQLLKESINQLPDVKKLYVNVEKDNKTGLFFYKAKGFKIETEYDDLFNGHVLKTIRMVLER